MKNKVKDIASKMLVILSLICILCPHFELEVEASVSKDQAGEAIASFAIDFYKKYGERVQYPSSNVSGQRGGRTYEANPGELQTYVLDCVGWVSYAIHHATGLTTDSIASGDCGFVVPENPGYGSLIGAWASEYFEKVGTYGSVTLKPGDILANSHHVMIYVGNTEAFSSSGFSKGSGDSIIDSRGHGPGNGLTYTTISEYGDIKNGDGVYRISQAGATAIKESDLCKIALETNKTQKKKKKDYDGYNGLPERGQYTGSESLSLEWVINLLSQIVDYLIGIITMGIKIELIGWATIIENIVTDAIQAITDTEITSDKNGQGGGESEESRRAGETDLYTPSATETVVGFLTDRNDRITAEKIIYNQIPVFDINVFNLESAAGKPLQENGTLSVIKYNIAKWYVAFRNVAIIGLLLVLIYVGIRMAISTVASDKAIYKRLLLDWAVSFIIVIVIHYFMIFVINLNESLVDIFKNMAPNQEISLYETVRTKAYEIKFSSGAVGTVLYLFLVYILFRYIFLYLKRYLAVNLLVIIAPIIGISYSIDKIKDNKSQSLTAWMKDFSFMVLLQSIHALVYTAFVSTVLDMTSENIAGVVLGMIVLNFMLKADKIVIHIFGMNKSKSLSSLLGSNIKDALVGLYAAKQWGGLFYKGAAGTVLKAGRGVGTFGGFVLPEGVRYGFNNMYNKAMGGLFGVHAVNQRRTNNRTTVSGIDQTIRNARLKNKKTLNSDRLAGIMSAKKRIVGFAKFGAAIPMAIADPSMLSSYGIFKVNQARKNGKIVYKASAKRRAGTKNHVRTFAAKGLLPVTGSIIEMNRERNQATYDRKKKLDKAQKQMAALEKAKSKEEDIIALVKELRNDKISMVGSDNPLRSSLKFKFEEEFDNVVEEQLKEIEKSYIEKVIEEYADEKGTRRLEQKDLKKILDKLEEELENDEYNRDEEDPTKQKIELFKTEALKNIKQAMKESANDRVAKGIDLSIDEQIKDIISVKKKAGIIQNIDNRKADNLIKDITEAMKTTKVTEDLIKTLDKSLKDNNITMNFAGSTEAERYEAKRDFVKSIVKISKEAESRAYSTNEMVEIFKKGLDKDSSIIRQSIPDEYKDIIAQMKELKAMSKAYKKQFKEELYSNNQLKTAMKKTKRAQDFDLYKHLTGEDYL